MQTELREYQTDRWTLDGCKVTSFGHETCLRLDRRQGQVIDEEIDRYGRLITIVQTSISSVKEAQPIHN
jgi:hypothetical protein